MIDNYYEKLGNCLATVFEVTAEEALKFDDFTFLSNWDSLCYMSLMLAIETEFAVSLDKEDIKLIVSRKGLDTVLNSAGI